MILKHKYREIVIYTGEVAPSFYIKILVNKLKAFKNIECFLYRKKDNKLDESSDYKIVYFICG